MSSSPPVRSVVRALDLLEALNRQAVSTLDVLHSQTRIPKSTLVRLLQTFESRGIVKHAPQHGAYFLTAGVRSLSSGYHSEPMVVEAAAPLMDALTLRVKWPLAMAMLEDNAMVVRYSTIPLSPLAMHHSTINVRLGLVRRAMGRAYLAFCTPVQREALLQAVLTSPSPEDAAAGDQDVEALRAVLGRIVETGYALPDAHVCPASNTLAVPIFDSHGVAASLGMTIFSSTMRPEQAVERYFADLLEVSRQVSDRLRKLQASNQPTLQGAALAFS